MGRHDITNQSLTAPSIIKIEWFKKMDDYFKKSF
jgi:hypothetical protein